MIGHLCVGHLAYDEASVPPVDVQPSPRPSGLKGSSSSSSGLSSWVFVSVSRLHLCLTFSTASSPSGPCFRGRYRP